MNRTDTAMSEGKTGPRGGAARAVSETSGQPAITVGVACYNVAPYLEQCIRSLLDQTFDDFEIVAVDDGSTDDTASILDELARTSGKVRVVRQDNEGPGAARNRILEQARGEYITFVDADDWLAPHCLEAAHDRAARDDLDILCFGWVRVDHAAARVIERRSDYKGLRFDRPDEIRQKAIAGRLNLMVCASLFRTALFHDHGLRYPAGLYEDMYVTPFLYLYAERHGYLDDELYFWRKRPDSITQRAVGKDHIDGMVGAFHEWKARLSREGRFGDFRASFVLGVVAYMSQLLRRIEDADVDRAAPVRRPVVGDALVAYLRDKARSFPELAKYRQYLSLQETRAYAKVIEIMDDEDAAGGDEPAFVGQYEHLRYANKALRDALAGLEVNEDPGTVFDFCFAPLNDYHVRTAVPIADRLRRQGFSVCFVDFTRVGRDEGVRTAVAELEEERCHDICAFIASNHGFRNLIVFNDWSMQTTYPLVLDARDAGAATVGFVEGINDFNDVDTGRWRNAYRAVEWVLGAGNDDRQYFPGYGGKFRVAGFPRIAESLRRPPPPPARERAVINVNFTYGVLEDRRDDWLASAIEGCRLANLDWVISRHPAETGDLSGRPSDPRGFADLMEENAVLISRFSSCIVEALAMGRAVVYHNPDIERVAKFQDPRGAYSVSRDARSLAAALRFELDRLGSVPARRNGFLAHHCDVSANFDPCQKAARILRQIDEAPRGPARDADVNPSPDWFRCSRDRHAALEETRVVAAFLDDLPAGSVMVDVGAASGGALAPFLEREWRVFAFEPDPENRARLQREHGHRAPLTVDARALGGEPAASAAFYSSRESPFIGSLQAFTDGHERAGDVEVTTLSHVAKEHGLRRIDVLKIDAEGYDLMVLEGAPWDEIRPRVIVCEFEDAKTTRLGYTFHDQARFLADKGYTVFVSEWYPVVRYGMRHDWRRLAPYPCRLESSNAWGNLIAFRSAPDPDALRAAVETSLGKAAEAARVTKGPPPKATEEAGGPVEARGMRDLSQRSARAFMRDWLTSPTVAMLALGLGLTFAGLSDLASSMGLDMWLDMWLTGAGLALVGFVIFKESVVWRWMRERDREVERARADRELKEALAAERRRASQALTKALADERRRAGQELKKAVAAERKRAERALTETSVLPALRGGGEAVVTCSAPPTDFRE